MTVVTTMKKLLENDFLRRVQNGVYQVNAKYIVKDNENKRRMVIDYYNGLDNSYVKNDESTAKKTIDGLQQHPKIGMQKF